MSWISQRRRERRIQLALLLLFLLSCGVAGLLCLAFYRAEAAAPMIGWGLWSAFSLLAACERWAAFRKTGIVIRRHKSIRTTYPF